MARDIKGYKVAKAFSTNDNQIHAVVIRPDGTTLTVLVPDWADKDDIKQEAARLVERAEKQAAPAQLAALEDPDD